MCFITLQYIYPNFNTMKKFNESMKKGEIDPANVTLPFTPMERVIMKNPRTTLGITGVRHIQKAGGLAVWPVVYLAKEQVRKNALIKSVQNNVSSFFLF